ncbi:uncharacterized protein [Rutidosis leptorrhynchoides]|uniref:uncharacterized protein n=1 Tax=Rutidosis leptorrhynchoides TaxID=125765 RepID=UPI003A99724C
MQANFEEWILCGDFIEVRKSSERKNCIFMEHRARMFNEFIDKAQLIEIPLGGMKFTRICDEGIKYSKLDRFLVSEKVAATWEGLTACSRERKHSDHCPIMLKDSNTDFGPKPVRVADCVVRDKLKNVKEGLKTIFNPRFNNLNAEISKLQKDVEKWENSLGNRDLNELEIATWIETRKKWLQKDKEKAEMLKQKSRIKWVIEGDENSKYIHSSIRRRQNKNNIRGVNINGTWHEKPKIIKEAAFKYFKDRFSSTHQRKVSFKGDLEMKLAEFESASLEAAFFEEDIFLAIKSCRGSKAPGPDGFNITFFQLHWDIIKNDLMGAFARFCDVGEISKGSLDDMKANKKKGFLFKVDFEKAFDTINWEYLMEIMALMGFGCRWRTWIGLKVNFNKSCVFGVGVSNAEVDVMASWLGCMSGSFPILYLGLPIGANMAKAKEWEPVFLKFGKKLADWKARSMSYGGRLTLIKSVLSSIPLYFFLYLKLHHAY